MKTKEKLHQYRINLKEICPIPQFFMFIVLIASTAFVLDYYNVPSIVMGKTGVIVFVIIIVNVLAIFTWWASHTHITDLFRVHVVNVIDSLMVILLCGVAGYSVLLFLFGDVRSYKVISGLSLIGALVFCIYKRTCIYKETRVAPHTNLLDLRDIYENKMIRSEDAPILVQETDVKYDLLKRDNVINQLYRVIVHAEPENSYVIALQGTWGSGKTTVINNVKELIRNDWNSDEYIIIDDFDPWLCGTQEVLLYEMYDILLTRLGVKYNSLSSLKLLNGLSETVAGEHLVGGLLRNITMNYSSQAENIKLLKQRINKLIQAEGKKVVFFIDNLDRADDNNIVFLFKLINLVFDLPRVVYVLSYEKERVDKILNETKEFNSRFSEKIIQQEITLYPVEKEHLTLIYKECMTNLLLAYGESIHNISDYATLINVLVNSVPNMRVFKRMINSVCSQVFCGNYGLYNRDLLAIETIRFLNMELYDDIASNARFFITYERSVLENHEVSFSTTEYNSKGKEVIDSIVERHSDYKPLLAELFPNVQRVIDKEDIVRQYGEDKENRNNSIQKASICNGRCFDLYFSVGTNSYIKIKNIVETSIQNINTAQDYNEVEYNIFSVLKVDDYKRQREILNRFTNYIDGISASKKVDVIVALIKNVQAIDDTYEFMIRSAYDAVIYVIRELILLCTDNEIEQILTRISETYQALNVFRKLARLLESNRADISECIKNMYEKMCVKIVDEEIDIFSQQYYKRYNSGVIYGCFEKSNLQKFQHYISAIISKNNIYKILADLITTSIGEEYIYRLRKSDLNEYFPDDSVLDELINQKTPYTDAERLIYTIYIELVSNTESCAEVSRNEPIEWVF